MDEPLVLAVTLFGPFCLGFLLRLKGAVLAGLVLSGCAAAFAAEPQDSAQVVGAAVLGALGGFALGWAGSLTRRLLHSRRPPPPAG